MSAHQEFIELRKKLNKFFDELKEEVKEVENTDFEPPDYVSIQNKEVLYNNYRDVIYLNQRIAKILSKVGRSIVAVKDLKNSVAKDFSEMSRGMQAKDKLEEDLHTLYRQQKNLEKINSSVESTIRFYQSVQYILASPKFDGYQDKTSGSNFGSPDFSRSEI